MTRPTHRLQVRNGMRLRRADGGGGITEAGASAWDSRRRRAAAWCDGHLPPKRITEFTLPRPFTMTHCSRALRRLCFINARVEAIVVGVGGFLGIGEKRVALPWDSIKLTEQDGGRVILVSATREQLEGMPT